MPEMKLGGVIESVARKFVEGFSASEMDSLISNYSKRANFFNRNTRKTNIPRLVTIRNIKEKLFEKQLELDKHKQLVAL